ncbi:MAG: glycosyltransferase family 39 protein [Planctomycetota bacterium]|nr:MAG: glycosyltransferase family 39 protein [Planctomycetota bacterium]
MTAPQNNERGTHLLWVAIGLGVCLMAVGLYTRPLMTIDETRYLTVAWEMRNGGDYIVPHLNGEVYSHKPPLLFWLVNIAWTLFGISDWVGRAVAPFVGLLSIWWTRKLAQALWPDSPRTAALAPLILASMALWSIFSTLTMFDTLVTFSTLITMSGAVMSYRGQQTRGWLVAGLGLGLGILAKGPVILVHTLPVLLLAPLWQQRSPEVRIGRWYAGVAMAFATGLAVAACWVLPAIIFGGEEYREAILWKQTAGRMVNAFDHRRPFWWYLPILPFLLLPWAMWGTFWKSLRGLTVDSGVRLCLIWAGATLLILSFVSGKQIHYILPAFPAIALLMGRVVAEVRVTSRWEVAVMGWGSVMLGALLSTYRLLPIPSEYVTSLPFAPQWGLVILLGGVAILWAKERAVSSAVQWVAVAACCNVAAMHFSLQDKYFSTCSVDQISQRLSEIEKAGRPIAHQGVYAGQYHFPGRLTKPFEVLDSIEQLQAWQEKHPDGYIVGYEWEGQQPTWSTFTDAQPYRRGMKDHRVGLVPGALVPR